ncbi:uncharacterized protein LOC106779765 [Vigna radiata var. radiata]|uniref:Uncharacterized protein LOC106779765 n=1 Tax=Vigna radiata var. radiata TaxID=3916 RepID=A0A3Q0FG11_VIGRR|nr:uncharacterized protein LOC106779765 [Vigna radiata var. radiata]
MVQKLNVVSVFLFPFSIFSGPLSLHPVRKGSLAAVEGSLPLKTRCRRRLAAVEGFAALYRRRTVEGSITIVEGSENTSCWKGKQSIGSAGMLRHFWSSYQVTTKNLVNKENQCTARLLRVKISLENEKTVRQEGYPVENAGDAALPP